MDKRKYAFLIIALIILSPLSAHALEKVKLYLFYSNTCPHCAKEKVFLSELQTEYSNLEVELLEVTTSQENTDLMRSVKEALKTENEYVPYTVIGNVGLTGYSENTANQIRHFVEKYSNEKSVDLVEMVRNHEDTQNLVEKEEKENIDDSIIVPILGKVNPKKISLPLVSIVIGFVDGFNPCAMWVLLFLIGMLLGMKDRKKMWILGLTFLLTSALVYLLFMLSWLKVALSIQSVTWIRNGIAIIALIAGIYNLYQFYKSKDVGCTVVKEEKRKKVFTKIRKIVSNKSFFLALVGIIVLAFSVNLIELACSAGLPLLFTQVLAMNTLSSFQYGFYLFLYILFFLIDDLVVFFIAMTTLKVTGISNRYTKYSHLIGGVIMVFIGILMLIKPEWLMFQFS